MKSESPIRCFVAVEIPRAIQNLLLAIQQQLHEEPQIAGGKPSWTKSGNFHLTLKFLGDIQTEAVGEVSTALQAATATQAPFQIEFGGIGAFPNMSHPRVVWVGIKSGATAVARLAASINRQLNYLGYSSENRFHPHLTLARLRNRVNLKPLLHLFKKYDTIDEATMTVHEITFMQSRLHPTGAIYTPLKIVQFQNTSLVG